MLKRSLMIGLISLAIISAAAAVPQKMNFQGRLTDPSGNPVTAAIDVKFSIFDAASGGTELWTETISSLTPDQGLVNQELGLTSPIAASVFSGETRYLAVKVGADAEMAPRIPLATVPFAFRAATVDTIPSGQAVTSLASSGATALRDAVTLSGGSGISLIQAGQNIQITAVSTAGGTVTQIDTGTGLTGGPITASGTVSIANGGVAAAQLATGAVTADAIADDTITEQKINMMNGPTNNYLLTYTATGLAWGSPGGTGTVTQVNTTAPITGGPINTTGTIAINQAGAGQDGYLSSVDWNTFNNKLDSADLSGYVQLGPATQQSTTAAYAINVKTTNASGVGISAEVNTASGRAISGINNYSTGGMGGYFQSGQISDGTLSIGVRGAIPGSTTYGELAHYINIVDSGTTKTGVYGYTSDSGSGVYGNGDTVGVLGKARNTTGRGVTGNADTTTGTNYGGYFTSASNAGYALYANAQAVSGVNYGLFGQTSSAAGYALYTQGGMNSLWGNTSIGTDNPQATLHVQGNVKVVGTIVGVSVETDSRDGATITARNNSTSGTSDFGLAIIGKTSLADTYGALGYEDVGVPVYAGVYAQAVDSDSYAIYAKSSSTASAAGYFRNLANNRRAIFAITEAGTGTNYAVSAQCQNASDYAIYGTGGNGGTALYGTTTSLGYALKTGTGMVHLAGLTGVGTDNPLAQLHVMASSGPLAVYTNGRVKMTNLSPAGAGTTLVVTSTGEVVPQSSSRRYKKEIVDYRLDLSKLNELRPVRFKWNDVSATPNQPDFGLIAEEVAQIYPELVALNQNGSPESVAYDKIGVILIKALQEKNREIEELKVRLKALEEKVK
ncbi:MAG: tail fiber domain-containing protein [Candidatus Margulisiibacteriota bacterium]